MYDLVVVGAGPAGLICATEAENLGLEVIVLEDHKEVGEPVNCAGLISISGLNRLGIKPEGVLSKVRGARIYSKNNEAEIEGKEDKAYILDRRKFDKGLAKRFKGELRLGEKCVDIKENVVLTENEKIEAKNIVIATGTENKLVKTAGFNQPSQFINTIQYEVEMESDPGFVELHVGSIAPGFFAWVIPTGKSSARIGLGTTENPKQYFDKFFETRAGQCKILEKSGGLIPIFEPGLDIQRGNLYLVGDAATQVKATTGGGIVMGGLSAMALAECIAKNKHYVSELASVGKELKNHLFIRNFMNRFDDKQYDQALDYAKNPKIKELIETKGDMDFVGPLMKGLIMNPTLGISPMKLLLGNLF